MLLKQNITNIVIVVAMEVEAQPIRDNIGMHPLVDAFDRRLPMRAYQANTNPHLHLVVNGTCPQHACDRVGTQAAALTTWESIKRFSPDLLISAGTAGGFKQHGAEIADVYIGSDIKYHNRRAPIPGFTDFLTGDYDKLPLAADLAHAVQCKLGVVSSGDSVYAEHADLAQMQQIDTRCKEMEAAAIAEVAQLAGVPVLAVKVITDFVDSTECTAEQFFCNYQAAVAALAVKVPEILQYLYRQ